MKEKIHCYLAEVKESHEGSGGGFSVVRFLYLVVENRTAHAIRSVTLPYRLMKGQECFQEDSLEVGEVGPGQTVKSKGFIRESGVFDRIEWISDPVVQSEQELSKETIKFDRRIPRSLPVGCVVVSLVGVIILALALYELLF